MIEAIHAEAYKDPEALRAFGEKHDPRTALVLTPLAHVWRDRPRLVAMEQVPTVLPVWEACADVMRELGYSVDVGVLHAEQYGVPQTRKRAILVARLDGEAKLPAPTHSRYYSNNPAKLDPGVKKWISMAEALGWGATDQPSHTVTAGTHGPTDRWSSGGNSVRRALDAKIGGPNWIDKPNQDVAPGTTYTQRYDLEDVAAIQTYPVPLRPEIADWAWKDVPAPTVCYRPELAPRGCKHPAPGCCSKYPGKPGHHFPEGTVRITVDEAATLQTYERPFVWPCTKTKAFLQVGNAVPPLLAQVVIESLTAVVELPIAEPDLLDLIAA